MLHILHPTQMLEMAFQVLVINIIIITIPTIESTTPWTVSKMYSRIDLIMIVIPMSLNHGDRYDIKLNSFDHILLLPKVLLEALHTHKSIVTCLELYDLTSLIGPDNSVTTIQSL